MQCAESGLYFLLYSVRLFFLALCSWRQGLQHYIQDHPKNVAQELSYAKTTDQTPWNHLIYCAGTVFVTAWSLSVKYNFLCRWSWTSDRCFGLHGREQSLCAAPRPSSLRSAQTWQGNCRAAGIWISDMSVEKNVLMDAPLLKQECLGSL